MAIADTLYTVPQPVQPPVAYGEVTLPAIQNPVFYEVHVPHPITTIVAFACLFLVASLIVWALDKYSYKDRLDPDTLPPPDRSVKRDIQINHEMAVYRARIRRQN